MSYILLRRLNITVFTCLNFHLPRCHQSLSSIVVTLVTTHSSALQMKIYSAIFNHRNNSKKPSTGKIHCLHFTNRWFFMISCGHYTRLCLINGFSDIMTHIFIVKFHPLGCLISIGTSFFQICPLCCDAKDTPAIGNDFSIL